MCAINGMTFRALSYILCILLGETSNKPRCLGYGEDVTIRCRLYIMAIFCIKISRKVSYF